MRDLMNNLHILNAIPPAAARTDNTAITTTILDTRGYDSIVLALLPGANTDATVTFAVTVAESTASNMASPTAIDAAYLNGTLALAGFQFDDDNESRKLGINPTKRYIQATITPATNDSGNIFIAAVWILGNPSRLPTANPPV